MAVEEEREVDVSEFTRHANEIEDKLWLGSEDAGQVSFEVLRKVGITHVIVPAYTGMENVKKYPDKIVYVQRYVPDIADFPYLPLWPGFIDHIDEALASGGAVLVHCAAGRSRSAALVIAYLMQKHGWSVVEAMSYVRSKRPQVSTKFEEQLRLWDLIDYSVDDPRAPLLSKFNQIGK